MSEQIFQAQADGSLTEVSLPEYLCHKTVRAAKIVGVALSPTPGFHRLALAGAAHVDVTRLWYSSKAPQVGGYYVQYEDGYSSYSPAEAFEQGYTPVGQADESGAAEAPSTPLSVLTAHVSGDPGVDVGLETTSSSLPADIPAESQVVVIDPKLSKKYPETYTISHVEYINKRVYYGVKGLNEIFLASQLAVVKPAAEVTSVPAPEGTTLIDNEVVTDLYIKTSGKTIYTSDCATSIAPAETPGPCDCNIIPSAEDLDAVAQEKAATEATAGAEQIPLDATGGQQGATDPDGGTFEPGGGAADTQ
jgi:hypothetical protein